MNFNGMLTPENLWIYLCLGMGVTGVAVVAHFEEINKSHWSIIFVALLIHVVTWPIAIVLSFVDLISFLRK